MFLSDGEDGTDNIFFNVDFNDGDRSWLTDILQEELAESKTNNVASQYKSIVQIHKRKKAYGLKKAVNIAWRVVFIIDIVDFIVENGTKYVLWCWLTIKLR